MIRWNGIVISFHPFFVIIMLTSLLTGHLLELLALFVIVFIHELGHVAAARFLGVKVLSVQMLPFGGVAIMEDTGHLTAGREILISLAGPLQNMVLIGLSLLFHAVGLWDGPFLSYFINSNLLIALFNLLPILPLDGGKISQSLCTLLLPYHATLIWSHRISLLFSIMLIAYSIIPQLLGQGAVQLNLLLVGSFLLYSNWSDYRNIPYRFLRFLVNRERFFSEQHNGNIAQPIVADKSKPLDYILRLFKREKYHFIYVVNQQGNIVAVVPEQRVISSYLRGNPGI
ncbi:sporulation factor SpoIVFB. Metallo peptidase. MEROPS family M50B [Fontibacillus panacisegetis]|uniref:Sporulation factor SpoIVFB. Metallo peptidase. MEROPS family M50B n=1 Tax=Fontibacillus panacisegetis TaxID=670482 RepID=A0A1G7JKN3_9BACL|nr:M50 family metallopeptidase [Fontibacillus panacisegetis]SDF25508.1 sporulation factor SpoIVFB. Metallo peptidase. MEROPS family M50B [Fontibacillus panacisegetis]